MSQPTPQETVLAITELLEAFLLQLDIKTLLFAQSVCKRWQAVIQNSPSLQRALFFKTDQTSPFAHNELLQKKFPRWFEHLALGPESEPGFTSITRNPVADTVLFPSMPWIFSNLEAYQRPEASWKRMLIHQPPIKGIGVLLTLRQRFMTLIRIGISDLSPFLMQDVLDASLSALEKTWSNGTESYRATSFRMLWRKMPPSLSWPDIDLEIDFDNVDVLRQIMRRYGLVLHINSVDVPSRGFSLGRDLVYSLTEPHASDEAEEESGGTSTGFWLD
ncbi:uncharacterized protein BCR38DRAFT_406442 [Pseudomassariella vexata]|uniref:F-box domain-containing protein n=1 Tax=Pseudomassariella vexata TaxID=1141098 RepID=A0A1Y2EAC6_9PEZI|nr:uncharacterized protein BCR38DRAFT_406442 [Pseudomassariella vexata]ORY68521.1 hypothetical protein BCR38DRAFT_406442 [Pseudomassariella vexata]